MEKKFLDKQGLAELNKSFKDEFARKESIPTKVSQLKNDSYFLTNLELNTVYENNYIEINDPKLSWQDIIFPRGWWAFRINNRTFSPNNSNGVYFVFTSFNIETDDIFYDEVNITSKYVEQIVIPSYGGKIYYRYSTPHEEKPSSAPQNRFPEVVPVDYNDSLLGVRYAWRDWREITKDFVMKDQLEKVTKDFAMKDELATKVDKVAGKGLSTNDYGDRDKAIVNGTATRVPAMEKALKAKADERQMAYIGQNALYKSQLTSEYEEVDGFADERVASQKAVHDLYTDLTERTDEIWKDFLNKTTVDQLPEKGIDNVLYLVKNPNGKENNIYLEYLWIDNKFELIGSTDVDLSQYVKKEELTSYAKQEDVKTKLSELTDDSTHRTVTDDEKAKWNGMVQKNDILEMINQMIEKKVKPDSIKGLKMTAVIDQSNPDPLACITYEDDAKDMTKGSSEWDKFFKTKLVLFKNGKEVRDLQDSELNSLTPDDGDVMVKFRRMGLNIHTVGDKVYVTMTDDPNSSEFKYYAHTRGAERREAFYLGAYLGYEKDGKLRSIKGCEPAGDKTIGAFRTIAQANGQGYDQLAFYQWTFIQAMFVLKYGNLDSQNALGRGLTKNNSFANTGGTNGKGIDFGTINSNDQMRFQYLEDIWGNKAQWCDGCGTANGKFWIGTDNFNDKFEDYQNLIVKEVEHEFAKKAIGNNEGGFVISEGGASAVTYYSDRACITPNEESLTMVGGSMKHDVNAGVFFFSCSCGALAEDSTLSARLMFL